MQQVLVFRGTITSGDKENMVNWVGDFVTNSGMTKRMKEVRERKKETDKERGKKREQDWHNELHSYCIALILHHYHMSIKIEHFLETNQ